MFDEKDSKQAIEAFSALTGIPREHVLQSLELAIQQTKAEIYQSGSQEAIAEWESIPAAGEEKNAYAFLACMGEAVLDDLLPQVDLREVPLPLFLEILAKQLQKKAPGSDV